jgi:hypothetical protein
MKIVVLLLLLTSVAHAQGRLCPAIRDPVAREQCEYRARQERVQPRITEQERERREFERRWRDKR